MKILNAIKEDANDIELERKTTHRKSKFFNYPNPNNKKAELESD